MSNPVYQTKPLKQVAYYSKERIDSSLLNRENYIGTDNLLQNKQGKQKSTYVPIDGTVTKYNPNDTLVANIRPYLKKIWFANCSGGASSDVLTFKVKSGYDPRFFYYSIFRDEFFDHMMLGSKGTRMPRGSKIQILEYPVPDIELEEQGKIAKTLSLLDSKIELNNRISHELEAAAKTIYDYWFVQFDFPDENGKPYKSSGGKMIWSEELKEKIPDGLEVKKVSELIAEDKSGDWGKKEKTGNYIQEVFCIRGADINGLNGKEYCDPPKRFISEKNSHKLLKAYDLIVEISGGSPIQSTGRIASISPTTAKRFSSPLICSNFCKALSLKDYRLTYNFHLFWNRLYDNKIFFGYEGKTSGIRNLLFDSFANTNFMVIPSDQIRDKFFDLMEIFEEKRQKILEENQKLTELRDWLLPMLMNGQIEVKGNEN